MKGKGAWSGRHLNDRNRDSLGLVDHFERLFGQGLDLVEFAFGNQGLFHEPASTAGVDPFEVEVSLLSWFGQCRRWG